MVVLHLIHIILVFLQTVFNVTILASDECEYEKDLLTADSADISIVNKADKSPLLGAGTATFKPREKLGINISGSNVNVIFVRFWIINAKKVKVMLFESDEVYIVVDVSSFIIPSVILVLVSSETIGCII